MNQSFEIENEVAYMAVENFVLCIPEEADPIGVVRLTIMDLMHSCRAMQQQSSAVGLG